MNEAHAHHLNKSDVELYVINALAMEKAAELEEHVAGCDACADALAHEAQLEMALEMLADRTKPQGAPVEAPPANVVRFAPAPARTRRQARIGASLAGALAAAAALILWVAPSAKSEPAEDMAKLGVPADAAGSMVSLDTGARPVADKLDGG